MDRLVVEQPGELRREPGFVLLFHHQDDIGPFNVIDRYGMAGIGTGARRARQNIRVPPVQLFSRWAAPLVFAANKQNLGFFIWLGHQVLLVLGLIAAFFLVMVY